MMSSSSAVAAIALREASNWWDDVNSSPVWQDWIFHILAGLFGLVSAVALVISRFLFSILG